MKSSDPITNLISAFSQLPGIGERSATRLAFFVMRQPPSVAHDLAQALITIKEKIRMCEVCCDLTDEPLCRLCASKRRDTSLICVVQSPTDLRAIEKTGDFQGTYHVLHGLISPLNGIGPDDIQVAPLLRRLTSETKSELIIATPPSTDGEATALYLSRLVKPSGTRVSRIASGVPIGGDLEYVDRVTLARALSQRHEI